jgi:hypothetical protein
MTKISAPWTAADERQGEHLAHAAETKQLTSVLATVAWAKNERGFYEMTGESMEALIDQHYERGYDQAVRDVHRDLLEQDDSEMDRAAGRVAKIFKASLP